MSATSKNAITIAKQHGDRALKIANANVVTLAMNGLDPKQFAGALQEAVLRDAKLIQADNESLVLALRKCCQDGLIPDGRHAFFYVDKGGKVNYQPMKDGLKKLIHTTLHAEIKSGFVREGDKVRVIQDTGEDERVITEKEHFGNGGKKVIGAWAWAKVPGMTAIVYTMNADDIQKARNKSKTRSDDSPWKIWPGPMAEKSAIKGLMNRLRYLIPATKHGEHLEGVLERDSDYNDEKVIEGEVVVNQDEQEEQEVKVVKEKPAAPKQAAKPASAKPVKPQPQQETEDPAPGNARAGVFEVAEEDNPDFPGEESSFGESTDL